VPRSGEPVRRRLELAAVELFLEHGYDQTTAQRIATRAGVTERTFFRHFADKREVLFGGEAELRETLTSAIAAVPEGTKPLPTIQAAFHASVPLFERNRSVSEPGARLVATTPALHERSLAKTASLVDAMAEALRARGTEQRTAHLCAQIGMDTFRSATRQWQADGSVELATLVDEAFGQLREVVDTLA
jgi:AcrR family transcriptional regulator